MLMSDSIYHIKRSWNIVPAVIGISGSILTAEDH